MLNGYEIRAFREIITRPVTEKSWSFQDVVKLTVNGQQLRPDEAKEALSKAQTGVFDVEVWGSGTHRAKFQIEFAIPSESDLDGVDRELDSLIQTGELNVRSIYRFTENCREYKSATRYTSGFENYLFGMLTLEDSNGGHSHEGPVEYTDRFNLAARYLAGFDRAHAEIVAAVVAFHYNHFELAVNYSRSPIISSVAIRFVELLSGSESLDLGNLLVPGRDAFDLVLADAQTESVLRTCVMPFNGQDIHALRRQIDATMSEYNKQKLRVISAEAAFLVAEYGFAREFADPIRDVPGFDGWYEALRRRIEEQQ